MSQDDYGDVRLAPGDRVIFSSRTIPGNEREVNRIINGLVAQGVEVITDRTHMVHVSGHPRRAEVAKFYGWVRPQIAVPAHGEPLHLAEHAAFARSLGVPKRSSRPVTAIWWSWRRAIRASAIRYSTGNWPRTGSVIIPSNDPAIAARVKLGFAGVISIAVAFTARGEVAGDPDVLMSGLPSHTRDGKPMDVTVDDAIFNTLDNLGRGKRRDPEAAANAIERSVRGRRWSGLGQEAPGSCPDPRSVKLSPGLPA